LASADPAEAAFDALLNDLASLEDSNRTWLNIATRLLKFCHEFAPSASAWVDDSADPWSAIFDLELRTIADLKEVDPAFFRQPPGQEEKDGAELNSRPLPLSSSATPEHVRALLSLARDELNPERFRDSRMSRAVVARGLAGAIDTLAGSAYLEWFRRQGQVTITKGEPYPVSYHDPRHWLPEHAANTEPDKFPKNDLSFTASLRIATGPLGFTYVLDFDLWDRLSLLGAKDDCVVMSATQPNLDFSDFGFRGTDKTTPPTYSNLGPVNSVQQADRIIRLVDAATAQGAEVVLAPEYSVTESVYTTLVTGLPQSSTVPIVFCAGLVRGPDPAGYMANEGWLLVNTPKISLPYTEHFHAKTRAAKLGTAVERIRPASEVRVFVSEKWSLCVLICVEVLATEIVDQLAKIGTNLILVPAMSEKTTSMAASVSRLCTESQAFVVMANSPALWSAATNASRCEAFFAGPYEGSPSSWCATLADSDRHPGEIATWVFRALQRTVSLHELPR
jgi:predicted amidohydrolase